VPSPKRVCLAVSDTCVSFALLRRVRRHFAARQVCESSVTKRHTHNKGQNTLHCCRAPALGVHCSPAGCRRALQHRAARPSYRDGCGAAVWSPPCSHESPLELQCRLCLRLPRTNVRHAGAVCRLTHQPRVCGASSQPGSCSYTAQSPSCRCPSLQLCERGVPDGEAALGAPPWVRRACFAAVAGLCTP